MLRHRGTYDGDRAFQSLKNGTGIPYAFFVSGRLTAARQETLATSFFHFVWLCGRYFIKPCYICDHLVPTIIRFHQVILE